MAMTEGYRNAIVDSCLCGLRAPMPIGALKVANRLQTYPGGCPGIRKKQ